MNLHLERDVVLRLASAFATPGLNRSTRPGRDLMSRESLTELFLNNSEFFRPFVENFFGRILSAFGWK